MIEEIWKDIEGFEGYYQVSNLSRIKSLKRHCVPEERILKLTENSLGYVKTRFSVKRKVKQDLLHRLVAKTFLPNPNNHPIINHIDGNPSNNSLENLEWCTQSHNIQHAYNTGTKTQKIGSDHHNSKLDDYQVMVIKHLIKENKLTYVSIAKYFNVKDKAIRSIKDGITWTHIIIG